MRSVRFHEQARLELIDEVAFYDDAHPGLGQRFGRAVSAAISIAASMPYIGSPYKHGTRRVFPTKFPFSVVYAVREAEIVILAVAHFKRRPGYWRERKA